MIQTLQSTTTKLRSSTPLKGGVGGGRGRKDKDPGGGGARSAPPKSSRSPSAARESDEAQQQQNGGGGPSARALFPPTPDGQDGPLRMKKSSSSPELDQRGRRQPPPSPGRTPGKKKLPNLRKLGSIRMRRGSKAGGVGDGSERSSLGSAASGRSPPRRGRSPTPARADGTPGGQAAAAAQAAAALTAGLAAGIRGRLSPSPGRRKDLGTIDGGAAAAASPAPSRRSPGSGALGLLARAAGADRGPPPGVVASPSSFTVATERAASPPPSGPRIARPASAVGGGGGTGGFAFVSDDGFTRRVDSYDGQVITCTDSGRPTYEVGNYLGGGVAGVVYEGKRLRPAHEYPPARTGGDGHMAVYRNAHRAHQPAAAGPGSPVPMTMKTSSLSSVRRTRSGPREHDGDDAGTGLLADVYRSVVVKTPSHATQSTSTSSGRRASAGHHPAAVGVRGPLRDDPADGGGGCAPTLFGNCFADDPLSPGGGDGDAPWPDGGAFPASPGVAPPRYAAVDAAAIEVPAAFSSVEEEGDGGCHQVVVENDADAPNRTRREARALVARGPEGGDGDGPSHRRQHSGLVHGDPPESDWSSAGGGTPDRPDVGETVAIKILNPVGFRLFDPDALRGAVIVREGTLPTVNPDGSHELREEHVWWLVNPNSRNLRSLQRRNGAGSGTGSVAQSVRSGGDDLSEESSIKRQGSHVSVGGGGAAVVDRGRPERGLRLSLVATYVDPTTNALTELPLPRCVEIWGHPPFAATDDEFEAMMEALLRLNAGGDRAAGGGGGGRRQRSAGPPAAAGSSGGAARSRSGTGAADLLARRRRGGGATVYCPALSAYIAIPAIPPKYLRWLKQRRLATKEVRNMMRIGRHRNVVHLYEVLELVQESKSTMFLILELVRGGELFDLISSNAASSRRAEGGGGTASKREGNAEHERTMRKFFRELASGIAFIHQCGVAHRDLKPENLLIHTKPAKKDPTRIPSADGAEEERTLKIADFGLSSDFRLARSPNDIVFSRAGDSNNSGSRWDGSSVAIDGAGPRPARRQSSGLPLSPQSERRSPSSPLGSGLSPLLNRVGATALSMLTCGSVMDVCGDDSTANDLTDDGDGDAPSDLRRMTSVVGSPHYVAPEIIAQASSDGAGRGGGDAGTGPSPPPQAPAEHASRRERHAARAGYDGTKADVWSAGVILYAMLFRSLPFGEDLLRCPRYQAFRKWYGDARSLVPTTSSASGKRNRRAHPDSALDPVYDEFDEEEMLGPHWFFPSDISAEGRDLIVAMLNPNPTDRLTIQMVLGHPWLSRRATGRAALPRMSGLCISGA